MQEALKAHKQQSLKSPSLLSGPPAPLPLSPDTAAAPSPPGPSLEGLSSWPGRVGTYPQRLVHSKLSSDYLPLFTSPRGGGAACLPLTDSSGDVLDLTDSLLGPNDGREGDYIHCLISFLHEEHKGMCVFMLLIAKDCVAAVFFGFMILIHSVTPDWSSR